MALNKINQSSTSVVSNRVSIALTKKPPVTVENLGNQLVINQNILPPEPRNIYYSSRLLNHVEPFPINGLIKTALFSEFSTNFQVGDRVFILNGTYDSDDYIQKDKYTKFTDGYRVLAIDGCKIILDIDYTGEQPYTDFDFNDLMFVHHINSQEKFDYINSMTVGLSYSISSTDFRTMNNNKLYSLFSGHRKSVVNLLTGNFIYVSPGQYNGSFDEVSPSSFINSADGGFYFKSSNDGWTNFSLQFNTNRIRVIDPIQNPKSLIGNKRIFILGEDFVWGGTTFRERNVYKYDITNKKWIFDKSYKQPIISRTNFRFGLFKGSHQDGIFGSYDRAAKFENATWNSGSFVNSNWIDGIMDSKSKKGEKNYLARLDTDANGNRIVSQNVDLSNNRGIGYNYAIDSSIKKSIISNGRFENSNIGSTSSIQISALDNYYNNGTTFSVQAKSGNFSFCDVIYTSILRSSVVDSILDNVLLKESKSVNNQLIDSVATQVEYNTDGGLQILGADVYSYYVRSNQNIISDYNDVRGVLKLFISDKDYLRMEKGDAFYIEKINKDFFLGSLNISERILLPLETRYILDYYFDSEKSTIGNKISVSLKNKSANRYKFYTKIKSTPLFQDYYVPDLSAYGTYWTDPAGAVGQITFVPPVQWVVGYGYGDYNTILYESNGITRMYFYLGDIFTGPGNDLPPIQTPTDTSQNGPGPNGEWWQEVGIWKGLWQNDQDITPLEGHIYQYLDPSVSEDRYLVRTNYLPLGKGYRIKYSNQVGETLDRTIRTEDSGFDACSIDLDSTLFGYYYDKFGNLELNNTLVTTGTDPVKNSLSNLPIPQINEVFANNYIKPADFRSGLFINSTWYSGYNVNYFQNVINKVDSYNLDISYSKPNTLRVRTQNKPLDPKYSKSGYDIKKGDYVWLSGVYYLSDNQYIDLGGRYLVSNDPFILSQNTTSIIEYSIESVGLSFSNLSNVFATFSVYGAEDSNYSTLSKFSIEKSTIVSGLFVRTNFDYVFFNSPDFNNNDLNFSSTNINKLRLVNIISSRNRLTFEDGVHLNSHLVDPTFVSGIVHESVWNGSTFSSGLFSSGYWKSGNFKSGLFTNSKDTTPTVLNFNSEPLYKGWIDGRFQLGSFNNSNWFGGSFLNGGFVKSNFYGGKWFNGILGSSQIPMADTTFGHYARIPNLGATCAIWYNGTVNNALMGGHGVVYWYNGKYNAGEFTSYGTDQTKESIWFNGEFNGSKITHNARWKNGTFNNGKFWSYFGWDKVGPTNSSTLSTDYGWEGGKFIKGEFGFKGLTQNSVWYDGEFYDGTFQGRFWNDGYFFKGRFLGSGVMSTTPSNVSALGEYDFANSFSYYYYGLWNDGYVIDNEAQTDQVFSTTGRLSSQQLIFFVDQSRFENMLWMRGTFSHGDGTMRNSLFLSGNFSAGNFNGGIFNPYVDRDFTGTFSNASFGNNAVWESGDFLNGSFYASEWKKGNFYNGYMSGAKWNDGTWFYGSADNILWLDGTWKNGNWNGSPFDYSLISSTVSRLQIQGVFATISRLYLNSGRERDLIYKVSEFNGNNRSVHMINVFSQSTSQTIKSDGFTSSRGMTQSGDFYVGLKETTVNLGGGLFGGGFSNVTVVLPSSLRCSNFGLFPNFELVKDKETGGILLPDGTLGPTIKPKVDPNTGKPTVTITDSHLRTFGGEMPWKPSGTPVVNGFNITRMPERNTPPSAYIYATRFNNVEIFTQSSTTYTIKMTVAVELLPTVKVSIYCGSLGYSTFNLDSDAYKYSQPRNTGGTTPIYDKIEDYYAKVYTITSVYTTTPDTVSTRAGKIYGIRKESEGVLYLLKCEITATKKEYNLAVNNRLSPAINLYSNTVDFFTSSVVISTSSENGKEVGLNFGNGIFKRGIWENGVWNNGYRSGSEVDGWNRVTGIDDIVKCFDVVSNQTYKIAPKTWKVTLSVFTNNLSTLDINKKVSIGNIVGIDANNNRKFFRDPIQISSYDITTMVLVVIIVSDFELKKIQRDSSAHLIYVTQNIWLNGVFLNGYFRGVWNNGLFKGNPRLTSMYETHFIDGTFDGGYFNSSQLYDDENRVYYNSSLIQNMTFFSNNTATFSKFLYTSWIDAKYTTQSYVNINSEYKEWADNPSFNKVDLDLVSYAPNLGGYPILDVLSSTSYFRDKLSSTVRKYSLGLKSTKSTNFIPNQGKFLDSIDNSLGKVDLKALARRGWTWSALTIPLGSVYAIERNGYKLIFESNSNQNNSQILRIYGSQSAVGGNFDFNDRYGVLLNNTNVVTQNNRYYQMEMKMDQNPSFRVSVTQSQINFNGNKPNPNLPGGNSLNHAEFKSLDKVEYFYNKSALDLWIYNQGNQGTNLQPKIYDTRISRIGFFEVDMIPFFLYATESSIDLTLKAPFIAIAPVIDYTNNNFDFIDNVDLGIDYRVINTQNNVTLAENVKGTSVPIEYEIQITNDPFIPEPFDLLSTSGGTSLE